MGLFEVDKTKIDLIVNLPPPTCVKDIRSFLGHARFYRRFIQDFSKIAKPLLAKDVPFHFFDEYLKAFNKLKEALTSTPILLPPIWGEPLQLMCDASDYAVRVVLGQHVERSPHVIYYVSHTLNEAQLNYTVTEKSFWQLCLVLRNFDPT